MIKKLFFLLHDQDRLFLLFLILFSILIAFVEMIGVTAVMPFISMASDLSLIESNGYYYYIYNLFQFDKHLDFVIFFGFILIVFYIFRGVFNLIYNYYLAKFANGRYHLFSYRLMENYLAMNYQNFTNKNSSGLTKTIISEAQNLTTLISSSLLLLSETFVLIMIYSMMFYVDYIITTFITFFLIINMFFLVKKVSKSIKQEGKNREIFQHRFYEIINSTFGNFKIIKLLSDDELILQDFESTSSKFAFSNTKTQMLYHVPRLLIESVAFILVIVMVLYLLYKEDGNLATSMSVVSMFVLGLYRLMPSANRIMSSYNIILYNYRALDIVFESLNYEGEELGLDQIDFKSNIYLKDINFGYDPQKLVLQDVNLRIEKGSKIAFVGPSGSGKSTLVDLIIGLYHPVKGSVSIDGILLNHHNLKNWRRKIGYIPQNVYLFDGTVAQNIAFGQEYNEEKIKNVLQLAKMLDFLQTHQNGLDTYVGEGGIKLSGGQKQRIAIARALYQEPQILVLDEATSALDEHIEKEIMQEIYEISQDKTLIIIAHRLSTIDKCDKVYKIEDKQLVQQT